IRSGGHVSRNQLSGFKTAAGEWHLLSDELGDRAWELKPVSSSDSASVLSDGVKLSDGRVVFPASFENLIRLKDLIQQFDSHSTIFPRADEQIAHATLGVGARFTTLHWPAVEWAMAALNRGMTANQNSIPRELVFDVDAMLAERLDTVPFPFIGAHVPEGHQGQSVQGMSHGAVISKLETGFHRRRIAWNFNADHQPIGGKFDVRERELVEGSILANYITFDLSPELSLNQPGSWKDIDPAVIQKVNTRLRGLRIDPQAPELLRLLDSLWPAVRKFKARDTLCQRRRAELFSTPVGRAYLRELSIDELPGITSPETTALVLALCEALEMPIAFVAPAFGFQKNTPYSDAAQLHRLIEAQWAICREFNASIGFHSGSGKSAENYQLMGAITKQHLEIKTSGRYTYEMGVALAASRNENDQRLWLDWYNFTRELACQGAFAEEATERKMARVFILNTLGQAASESEVFASPETCRRVLESLKPDPDHMIFFEYNFLYVLASEGRAEKSALGDHSPTGYRQRARFYSISDEARLGYAKRVASYLIFLAENTGLSPREICIRARAKLEACSSYAEFVAQIAA
ncbi:MAG TPA: tagaturonate epimerase family protein, partial [Opitutaceae bacterium]